MAFFSFIQDHAAQIIVLMDCTMPALMLLIGAAEYSRRSFRPDSRF